MAVVSKNVNMTKLDPSEIKFFEEMNGLYFPLLIIKRNHGVSFDNDMEEINWAAILLKNNNLFNKGKFYKYVIDVFGVSPLVKYIWQSLQH